MYDLLIIGGGPAGLTAAIYAVRKHMNVLLLSPELGGKANVHTTIEGIDAYQVINGADVVRRFRNEIEYLDFARLLEKVTKLEKAGETFAATTETGRVVEGRTVILATGANGVRLKVPGADRFWLKGLMYSTVSYAPLFVGKEVAVIGSGRMALRGASELAQIAKQVYLIAPDHGELDSAIGRHVTGSSRVKVFEGWQPSAVDGDTYLRRLTVKSNGDEQTLHVDGVFVELGLVPNADLVAGWANVNEHGHVVVNCSTETSVPGLFAAGDVTDMPAEQVLIAIGEGAKAAINAFEYMLSVEEGQPVA